MAKITGSTEMPAVLVDGARFQRAYISALKSATRLALQEYQQGKFNEHFKKTNRREFKHAKRRDSYKSVKRRKFGSITDLVKTGKTREYMRLQRAKISTKGNFSQGVSATMYLKFPFPVADAENPKGVGPAQMRKEIEAWSPKTESAVARSLHRHFVSELLEKLEKSPKLRTRARAAYRKQ